MYIYKIVNKVNNKLYVGLTSKNNLRDRWEEHLTAAYQWQKEEIHKSKSKLYPAMCKYGIDNFYILPLKWCETFDELNYFEDYFIESLQARDDSIGYNISKGGGYKCDPWNKGLKNAQEKTSAMLAALDKGRHLPASEKQRKQLSDRRRGIVVKEETRKKLHDACSGYKWMIDPNSENPKAEQVKVDQIQSYLDKGYQFGMKVKQ